VADELKYRAGMRDALLAAQSRRADPWSACKALHESERSRGAGRRI
jgi:hypothetical protein